MDRPAPPPAPHRLLAAAGLGATVGLVALGFTSVYREGFEVVLFLQNLELKAGSARVLEGVAIGLAGTAVVGVAHFWLHQPALPADARPDRRARRRRARGDDRRHGAELHGARLAAAATDTPFTVPEWMGSWFEMYPYWETLGAQALAGAFVVGSYYAAEYVKVKRPRREGREVAVVAEAPPVLAEHAA